MENWIEEVLKLPEQWANIAAEKAYIRLKNKTDKDIDGMLAGYHLAIVLLDKAFSNYARQKHTLSDEQRNELHLAVKLAKVSLPDNHPLLSKFLRNASNMDSSFEIKEN